ncbi:MBL fold metallo-hydrolase [Terrarubrum flagellatum]|uniref:MBL fold metallo-hydrolase n=1 Tax=Terrirubrum flagellatum TaxID=2895980 RepID=UPI003144E9AB
MKRVELKNATVFRLIDASPPPADWAYAFAAHAAEIDATARRRWAPDGLFHTNFSAHAIVSEGTVALIDAGLGPEPSAYFNGLRGRLDQELSAASLTPDMVSCVMFTHLHLDHVGWASRDGQPCFPNARYVIPKAELAHWKSRGAEAALPHHVAAFERHIAPLLARGLVDERGDGERAPGAIPLAYRLLPGHTAGHSAVMLEGGDAPLVIAGDSWHSPAQIERLDWSHRADHDPEAAVSSRMRLAQWASGTNALIAAGHFPEDAGFGHVEARSEGGFVWRPLR